MGCLEQCSLKRYRVRANKTFCEEWRLLAKQDGPNIHPTNATEHNILVKSLEQQMYCSEWNIENPMCFESSYG